MQERVHNFAAGPASLPLPVIEQIKADLPVYTGAGASVMEISHRSKEFSAIHESAKSNIRKLLNVPGDYEVIFCQGGATMQFAMVAMNFMGGKPANYQDSGSWAKKAIGEAERLGAVRVAWSGKDGNYTRVPAPNEPEIDGNGAYVHFTSNETIQGIEYTEEPAPQGLPLICDASSDFLSRPVDMSKYALMYAGAQKNIGPAGVTVAIIRKDMLDRVPENLPSLLDYRLIAEKDSLYNTPPCFAIYVVGLVSKWLLEDIGGLEKMQQRNQEKAQLLYDVLDNSEFYRGHADKDSRSLMNVTFRLPDEDLEKRFVEEATAQGMHGLKGHRSVGGCRASIYNAMTMEGCEALRDFMQAFEKKNG